MIAASCLGCLALFACSGGSSSDSANDGLNAPGASGTGGSADVGSGGGATGAGEAGSGGSGGSGYGDPSGNAGTGGMPAADAGPPEEEPQADAGVCDTENPAVLYLSADDSNSMAGAAVARDLIGQGQLAFKGLRTYEFLNYYSFLYPPAPEGEVLVSAQMHANDDGTYNLQIGVRAPDQTPDERRPFNLTLSVDTSSSMAWGPAGNTAMDRVKESCTTLAGEMRDGDIVSIATWNESQHVLLDSHVVTGPDDPVVLSHCASLHAYGATDIEAGLAKSYELASVNFDASRINRVILLSDGGDNVPATTKDLIRSAAQDGTSEAIYLMGVGVGDPWNYNDEVMDLVTDAGKGAYIFLDTTQEAQAMFGPRLLSNLEVAARNVQVEVTLPPTLEIVKFHGEQMSTNPEEVEPQHLAMGDAMVFHQVLASCDPDALDPSTAVSVKATYEDPITRQTRTATFAASLDDLLAGEQQLLRKGDAVVAYAEALKEVQYASDAEAVLEIDQALGVVHQALTTLGGDPDLVEIKGLLEKYRGRFDGTGGPPVDPVAPKPQNPVIPDCSQCASSVGSLESLRCAADLCDSQVFVDQSYTSPTDSPTAGTYAAVSRFGSPTNGLAPQHGGSYALIASGPATGTSHSVDLGGSQTTDPFASDSATPVYNAMEWRLRLKAPPNANGFSVRYVFFSEEYDDYIGSQYNDKFYIFVEAGSTNSGARTVVNFTSCRDGAYYDFICGQGMQHCTPGQRHCYIAVNTAMSECCWYGGCPNGTAETDISGTGFECAGSQGQDGDNRGSSTGWLETQWPIEPNEEFELIFHIHDSGDGIFDSEAIIDRVVFLENVRPGTTEP